MIPCTIKFNNYLLVDKEKITQDIVDKVRNNDFHSFINNSHDKRLN